MASHAQSFQGAGSETTGYGLEASARKPTERSLLGAKGTVASLPHFTVRTERRVLTPQTDPRTPVQVQYQALTVCRVLYAIKNLAPLIKEYRMSYTCITVHAYQLRSTERVLKLHVCVTVHAYLATTD